MKISNETKVGVLTIVSLVILILGFNFLKGRDIFKKKVLIYAVFNDLGGLNVSNEVKVNGYVIGNVYKLNKKDKYVDRIVATINLKEDVLIPKDSKAIITSPLVGSYYINIVKGKKSAYLESGDTLESSVDVGILDDVRAQLTPTLSKVRNTLDSLNTVFSSVNGVLSYDTKTYLTQTMANLSRATAALNGLLDNQNGPLARTLNYTSAIAGSLKNNTADIDTAIANAKLAMQKFAGLELKPTIDTLTAAISEMKKTVAAISNPNGTLGAVINDKTLYNRLNNAILSAEILIDDLKAHPKRYVNLSIFGKKDKGGYLNSPLPKDTVPAEGNK